MDAHRGARRHGRLAAPGRADDGAAILVVECQQSRIDMRLRTGYLDVQARDLAHALELVDEARAQRRGLSIALCGNAAEVLPRSFAAACVPTW